MMSGFKEFLLKQNALALAVGVIIGAAMGKVVSSLVNDVLMPVIGLLMGGVDFGGRFIALDGNDYPSLEAAKAAGAATMNYGLFINAVVDFVIVAFVVYMITTKLLKSESK